MAVFFSVCIIEVISGLGLEDEIEKYQKRTNAKQVVKPKVGKGKSHRYKGGKYVDAPKSLSNSTCGSCSWGEWSAGECLKV